MHPTAIYIKHETACDIYDGLRARSDSPSSAIVWSACRAFHLTWNRQQAANQQAICRWSSPLPGVRHPRSRDRPADTKYLKSSMKPWPHGILSRWWHLQRSSGSPVGTAALAWRAEQQELLLAGQPWGFQDSQRVGLAFLASSRGHGGMRGRALASPLLQTFRFGSRSAC